MKYFFEAALLIAGALIISASIIANGSLLIYLGFCLMVWSIVSYLLKKKNK